MIPYVYKSARGNYCLMDDRFGAGVDDPPKHNRDENVGVQPWREHRPRDFHEECVDYLWRALVSDPPKSPALDTLAP